MREGRFTVSARIPEGTSKVQFREMLRNLVVDRFQLKYHFQSKEIEAYDLVVAKGGVKMKESSGTPDADEKLGRVGGPKADPEGFPILPAGRVAMVMAMANGRAVMRHSDESVEQIAAMLADQLGRPVTDATGLKGKYDFTLKWVAEGIGTPDDDSAPNLLRAVQEQLGLKLEPKKTTVRVLTIDHVDKTPTEN